MLRVIEQETGLRPDLHYRDVRPGDQPLYISDTSKLERATGWRPRCSLVQTLASIRNFWEANRGLILSQRVPAPTIEMVAEEVA